MYCLYCEFDLFLLLVAEWNNPSLRMNKVLIFTAKMPGDHERYY